MLEQQGYIQYVKIVCIYYHDFYTFDTFQCPICKREFVSDEYLQSHIHRRHPNHLPDDSGVKIDQQL